MEKIPKMQISEEAVKMYEVQGHKNISESDLSRYQKDKTQDSNIQKVFNLLQIDRIPEDERSSIIRQALEIDDCEFQLQAAKSIRYAPENEREDLRIAVSSFIKQTLESDNQRLKLNAAKMIMYAPENEHLSLIKQALESDNLELQFQAAVMIPYAPRNEREDLRKITFPLIKQALESNNLELQLHAADMIIYVPDDEQEDLMKSVFPLIKKALESDNLELQSWAEFKVLSFPESERSSIIKRALEGDNLGLQLKAIDMIRHAPENEQEDLMKFVFLLVKRALESDNHVLQLQAAPMISYAPENERENLRAIVSLLIKKALESDNLGLQLRGAELIWFTPKNEQEDLRKILLTLIKKALESDDLGLQLQAAVMISYVPKNEQEGLKKLLTDKGLIKYLIIPPLYENNPEMNSENFSRRKFNKTGSGTTLVGGSLKDKIIIRHIAPGAFLAWQRLYEDFQLWKNNGFDYVPIEPIQSYKLTKEGIVDVYSGVLDLNLDQYSKLVTSEKLKPINIQRDKIIEILKTIGVDHGHAEDHNFCLRFFRDENGEPDLTKTPRLYLIDFDQAISS